MELGILYWLIDWYIDDVSRDARSDDQISAPLAFEDRAGVFGAVEDTVDWES